MKFIPGTMGRKTRTSGITLDLSLIAADMARHADMLETVRAQMGQDDRYTADDMQDAAARYWAADHAAAQMAGLASCC